MNEPRAGGLKRIAWPLMKWTLCSIVLGFVAYKAFQIWKEGRAHGKELHLHWPWLLLSGIAYTAGWLPSVWFWRKLMRRLGGDASYLNAARAYYCGHLGKYIPGKAMVLVIRGSMLRERGCQFSMGVLTATYETLVMMGAGALIGLALAPALISPQVQQKLPDFLEPVFQSQFVQFSLQRWWFPPLLVAGICLLMLPVLSRLFNLLAVKMTPDKKETAGNISSSSKRIDAMLLGQGLLLFVVGWMLHGLSLGCILKGVGIETFHYADCLIWTGTVSLATAVGFAAVFAPGGAGIREGILIAILSQQQGVQGTQAVAVAFLLRIVWLLTELSVAAVLYLLGKNRPAEPGQHLKVG